MLKFKPLELTWEKYMGGWKEYVDIPTGNDFTLYKADNCDIPKHDYDNVFSIRESKQQYGCPNLTELINLLIYQCSEIATMRNKPNIGYYADAGQWAKGYRELHSEDIKHIEGALLRQIPSAITSIDFILSSSGGFIEASVKCTDVIRRRFKQLSVLLPGSTYSAAVLMALAGDELIFQSFAAHLAPINPRINGFDSYIGKKMLRVCGFYSLVAPWAVKHLPEAQIKANNVTMQTLISVENFVTQTAQRNLAKYLFKVDTLSLINRIKARQKISRIVKFLSNFKQHLSHIVPFLPKDLMAIGLPVKLAEASLDARLRIIRNICEEITTNCWSNEKNEFFVRKLYFSGTECYMLQFYPVPTTKE